MGLTLIVTERLDPHAEIIQKELERRGHAFLRFDVEDFPQQRSGSYSVEDGLETLEICGRRIAIDEVDAVWYRLAESNDPAEPYPHSDRRSARLEYGAFVQGLWHRLSHVRWVSSPAAIRAASDKFDQLIRARQCGFSIGSHLDDISSARGVLRRVIPKAYEIRITVFGERVFACRIPPETRGDWRAHNWDDPESFPAHEATTISDDLAESCRLLVRDYGLAYAAIDMIVTPNGEHVFLELNPNGQWAWIEERTGLPLGRALIDVLRRAS
jgi:hypothetical protein